MNVYVIYRFDHKQEIFKKLEQITELAKRFNHPLTMFYFDPDNHASRWHKRAVQKLKACDLVVFFDNLEPNEEKSHSVKHIRWELDKAEELSKRIVVFKKYPDYYCNAVYGNDYSDLQPNCFRYTTYSYEKIDTVFTEEFTWSVENSLLRNAPKQPLSDTDKQLLLEQYRIMIDTSEKLMERRQETVNLYITLCTTLIAFLGASFAFGSLLICAIISLISGLILSVLCHNWRLSLLAYNLNNTGKFEVINEIERNLPAEMFNCEYRYNQLKGIRSYSAREKILPCIFTFFGILLMLLSVALFIIAYIG